ncbi:hypothetical protein V6N11_027586 [Hibiscus sabdariffa]|uniref:Uncharacterized protein n=1 Tax=Hibiscus sabdariffa TaxID=183260 RepID=A0ABR2NJE4_9ROSI
MSAPSAWAGLDDCSSSSGLEGAVLETVLPTGDLPFLWVEPGSGAFLEPAPVGKLGQTEYGAPLTVVVEWQRRSQLGVSPCFRQRRSCLASILSSWLLSYRIWSGAASSDWVGGGDNGVLGAEPKGESGVDCLLAVMAARVEVGLGVEVWLGTGKTCRVAAGGERAAAGADGNASSGAAAGEWAGRVGGVGIATLMGAASAMSILCMYSFLHQPAFSAVYLSHGWVGTAALL